MPEGGPVEPGEDQGLLPGRPLAGVDVDEGEGRPLGMWQLASPGVDLERRLVAEPAQRRRAVGNEVGVGGASLDAGLAPARQPGRVGRTQVLLPEPGRAGAVREALEVERPVDEVGQHRRGDPREVADQLALDHRPVIGRCRGGREEHLVEVGELQLDSTDRPGPVLAEPLERRQLLGGGRGPLRPARGLRSRPGRPTARPRCRGARLFDFAVVEPVRFFAVAMAGASSSPSSSPTSRSASAPATELATGDSRTTDAGSRPSSIPL